MNNLNSAAKIPKSEDVEFKINSDSGNNFWFDSSEIKKILNLNIRDLKELFDFVQIIRDGNCFYRAIAKGILHDQELYNSIKFLLFNYNENNPQILSNVYSHECVKEIMIKILKPGEYGDYSFIYSIPNCFQISMIIFSDDYSKPLTFPDNIEQYKHCLLLVHKSEHFTLLERKKSKTLYVENHEKPEKNKSFNKKEELIRSESSNYSGSEENSENNDDIDEIRAIIEDIDEKRYSIPYDKNECYLGGNREASNHTSYDEVLAFLENIPKNYEENRKNFTAWKI